MNSSVRDTETSNPVDSILKEKKVNPSRYHPALVALHWFLAVFIVAALILGMFALKTTPNSSPDKIAALRAHMGGGIAILVLMGIRLFIRVRTSKPNSATIGNSSLDRLAPLSHYGFYLLIFLMVGTGLATALYAGLFGIVFGHSGAPLPETFMVFPTRVMHGFIAKIILGLIGLHVLAALYHQFIRQDGLIRRMWFGRRWPARTELPHSNYSSVGQN
jgi:cytochrome b561